MYLSQAATPEFGPTTGAQPAQASLAQQIIQAVGAGFSVYNQQKLANLNRQLVQQGKPPVQVQDVPGMVPQAQVNVGIDPAVSKLLLFGALGLGALMMFKR